MRALMRLCLCGRVQVAKKSPMRVRLCVRVQVAKKLRALPSLEVGLLTLALVGAPNVGKSSLVQVGQVWLQGSAAMLVAWRHTGV